MENYYYYCYFKYSISTNDWQRFIKFIISKLIHFFYIYLFEYSNVAVDLCGKSLKINNETNFMNITQRAYI